MTDLAAKLSEFTKHLVTETYRLIERMAVEYPSAEHFVAAVDSMKDVGTIEVQVFACFSDGQAHEVAEEQASKGRRVTVWLRKGGITTPIDSSASG